MVNASRGHSSSNSNEEDEDNEEKYEDELEVLKAEEAVKLEEENRRLTYVPPEVTIRQLFRLQNVCYFKHIVFAV